MKKILTVLALAFVAVSCNKKEGQAETAAQDTLTTEIKTDRIVSLNRAITDKLAALVASKNIMEHDVTSTFPGNLKATVLRHVRYITAGSILSLQPSAVFATTKDINP